MDRHSNGHPEPPTDEYPPDPPEICRYCRAPVQLLSVEDVFGESEFSGKLYYCEACGARVGTRSGTDAPLGYLADAELRRWRRVLHEALDPIWQETQWPRSRAYSLIEEVLDVPEERAHVAMLSQPEIKNMVVWLMRNGPQLS